MSLTVEQRIALHQYWTRFIQGLMQFVAGSLLLFAGYLWWIWLQVPAALLMLSGAAFAIYGYTGILRFRLIASFSLRSKSKTNDPQ